MLNLALTCPLDLTPPHGAIIACTLDIEAEAQTVTHTDWAAVGDTHEAIVTERLADFHWTLWVPELALDLRELVKRGYGFEAYPEGSWCAGVRELREWVVGKLERGA